MDSNFNLSFADILRFIWRGLPAALMAAIIVGAIVYLFSQNLPEKYEASATVLAAQNSTDARSLGAPVVSAPSLDVSAYRKAVLSAPVLQRVMTALELVDQSASAVDDFANSITIRTEAASDSSLIDISVTSESPEAAMQRANLLAAALVDWDRARASDSLNRVVTTLEQQLSVLDRQIQALRERGAPEDQVTGQINLRAQQENQLELARALSSSAAGLLSIIEPALLPEEPVAPRPILNTVIAGLLTLLLAYGLLHLLDSLNPGDIRDIAGAANLPVLANFSKSQTGSGTLQASNYLRNNLMFSRSEDASKIILVTSARAREGKTKVAISLAESFVRNGSSTLLVDANLRHPQVAAHYKMLGTRLGHTALETWLKQPEETRDIVRYPLGSHDLHVVPSFRADPDAAELLSSSFRRCLEHWQSEYDVIIIDSAPVLEVADTMSIAPYCSDTVLVIREKSQPRQLRAALDMLRRVGVQVGGVVTTADKTVSATFNEGFSAPAGAGFGFSFRNTSAEGDS